MSRYEKTWDCCGDTTITDAWEPDSCPFCSPAASPGPRGIEMTDLPAPAFVIEVNDEPNMPVYTADQMRAYAEAAIKQEREACASLAEDQHFGGKHDDDLGWTGCAAHVAYAIRSRG